MNEVGALRRQLGWLLLWALLPLPFLYIILPVFWLIAGAAGIFLVVRPETVLRPSKTVLNLVAVAIFVVFVMFLPDGLCGLLQRTLRRKAGA